MLQSGRIYSIIYVFLSLFLGALILGCSEATTEHTLDEGQLVKFAAHFPSEVPGISLPGARILRMGADGKGALIRGRGPTSSTHFQELADYPIDTVIIFKKETKSKNVEKEMRVLSETYGFNKPGSGKRFYHYPMVYNSRDYKTSCQYTINVFRIIREDLRKGRRIFFHCTHGQDRTGYLAGMYRLMSGKYSAQKVFHGEMCANGYGAGSPTKPPFIVGEIRKGLTNLYLKMAYWIKKGKIRWDYLGYSICDKDPGTLEDIRKDPAVRNDPDFQNINRYRCKPASNR